MAPPMKATLAQQRAVWRLRAAGVTINDCAEVVFGDVRYRGRVERIDRRRRRLAEMPEDQFWRLVGEIASEESDNGRRRVAASRRVAS